VLTQDRLDELVPIEPARMDGRQIIEWDKDDIDELKFMKVDVPGAGHADLPEARPGFAEGSQGDRRWILPPFRRRIRAPMR
jgi:hypothetical protein